MDDRCEGCALRTGRREFLEDTARMAFGMLAIRYGTGVRFPGLATIKYPIPATDGATIDKKNQVILVRHQGKAYAFALSCPHQNTALKWREEEHRFQCPKHKSQYDPDGTFLKGRATRNMDRLPIRLEGKELAVDVDHMFESDKDPKGWGAAAVTL
jgi:nitrite reductase/ring-hydroxylating ferredoxin subunit